MPKKKSDKNDILALDFTKEGLNSLFKNLNNHIKYNTKILNKHITNIKKSFVRYEEPFCEIRQNHRGMNISVKLPDVKKKDIFLNITSSAIELKANSVFHSKKEGTVIKTYHRIIDIPSCSISQKTKAEFKRDKLKITVPYEKIKSPQA